MKSIYRQCETLYEEAQEYLKEDDKVVPSYILMLNTLVTLILSGFNLLVPAYISLIINFILIGCNLVKYHLYWKEYDLKYTKPLAELEKIRDSEFNKHSQELNNQILKLYNNLLGKDKE